MCFLLKLKPRPSSGSGDAPFLGKNSMETPIGQVAEESLITLRKIFLPGDIPQCKGEDTREGRPVVNVIDQ